MKILKKIISINKNNKNKYKDLDLFFIISYFLALIITPFWFFKSSYEVISALLGLIILTINFFLFRLEYKRNKIYILLTLFLRYIFILLGFLILYLIFKNINYSKDFIYLAYGINISIGVVGAIIFVFIYTRK